LAELIAVFTSALRALEAFRDLRSAFGVPYSFPPSSVICYLLFVTQRRVKPQQATEMQGKQSSPHFLKASKVVEMKFRNLVEYGINVRSNISTVRSPYRWTALGS
jgi:hypothetical protein